MSGYVQIGEIIAGKFRVDSILGIGGMGMVVAATHLDLAQEVAIKLMLPHGMSNASAVARFMHEAQAVARMRGEHVCRVHDVGTREGIPYIVMERLIGQDLSQLLAQHGPLPLEDAVDCLMQVLDALAEAHGRGIVHRDLKPSNIFITTASDGSALVKLLDFGISKSSGGATRTGESMGTPAYMAPEQMASSKLVDARADLWAMGVIAYELVTGHNPFATDTLPGTVMRVMQFEPPPLAHVPPGFAAAVMGCLARVPDARFASAAELADALAPFASPATSHLAHRISRGGGRRGAGPTPNSGPQIAAIPTTLQAAAGAASRSASAASAVTNPPSPRRVANVPSFFLRKAYGPRFDAITTSGSESPPVSFSI